VDVEERTYDEEVTEGVNQEWSRGSGPGIEVDKQEALSSSGGKEEV
jgi:hypothetical protein